MDQFIYGLESGKDQQRVPKAVRFQRRCQSIHKQRRV